MSLSYQSDESELSVSFITDHRLVAIRPGILSMNGRQGEAE